MTSSSRARPATVLAVTSGKGGVGKTHLAINLAVSLARLNHRVTIIDADFGLGNVDVMLGLTPEAHVGHLLAGERTLRDVLAEGPGGVRILPAGSGLQPLTALTAPQRAHLNDAIAQARAAADYLVIDSASGISDNVVELLTLADQVLLVTSLDPAALVDAYALAKVVWRASATTRIGLVVNAVRDAVDARLAFRQIDLAAARFLGHRLEYLGYIPEDPAVRDALRHQRALVDHLPQAPASRSYRLLASRLSSLRAPAHGLRLVHPSQPKRVSSDPATPEVPQCA